MEGYNGADWGGTWGCGEWCDLQDARWREGEGAIWGMEEREERAQGKEGMGRSGERAVHTSEAPIFPSNLKKNNLNFINSLLWKENLIMILNPSQPRTQRAPSSISGSLHLFSLNCSHNSRWFLNDCFPPLVSVSCLLVLRFSHPRVFMQRRVALPLHNTQVTLCTGSWSRWNGICASC